MIRNEKVLVTGIAGTGKSTVANALQKRGVYALDSDENDICVWKCKDTGRIGKRKSDEEGSYRWTCDIERLQTLLFTRTRGIIVCGIAWNQLEFVREFDTLFLLQCSKETLVRRLTERTNNPYGKTKSVQQTIVGHQEILDNAMIELGATPISSEQPIGSVVDAILARLTP